MYHDRMDPQQGRRLLFPDSVKGALIGGLIAVVSSQVSLCVQHRHDEERWRQDQNSRAAERAHAEELRWLDRAIDALDESRKQLFELDSGYQTLGSEQTKYVEARIMASRDHKPAPSPDPEMLQVADRMRMAADRLELMIQRVIPIANSAELLEALDQYVTLHKALAEEGISGHVVPILSPLVTDSPAQQGTDIKRLRQLTTVIKRIASVHTRLSCALGAAARELNLRLTSADHRTPVAKAVHAALGDEAAK
jgi:hypothetical protein